MRSPFENLFRGAAVSNSSDKPGSRNRDWRGPPVLSPGKDPSLTICSEKPSDSGKNREQVDESRRDRPEEGPVSLFAPWY